MSKRPDEEKTTIRGKVVEGAGVGRDFTRVPWVRAQFISKLGIDPYPGTLNLEVAAGDDFDKFAALKKTPGVDIPPEDPSFCSGKGYPVLIGGRMKGAIILPMVEKYPENKMELIASENVKESLSVETGDDLEVEIL